jgi:hypothetical protein
MKLKPRQFADLREGHCGVYGVELTSRALSKDGVKQTTQSTTDAKHIHTITYQEEAPGILYALQKAFNTPPRWTDSTTAVAYLSTIPAPCTSMSATV